MNKLYGVKISGVEQFHHNFIAKYANSTECLTDVFTRVKNLPKALLIEVIDESGKNIMMSYKEPKTFTWKIIL